MNANVFQSSGNEPQGTKLPRTQHTPFGKLLRDRMKKAVWLKVNIAIKTT